jgi:Putative collagen-binding domain of a collagenase/Protein of unknown function (DUF4038)
VHLVSDSGTPFTQGRSAYAYAPPLPAYVIEDYYEGEHGTTAVQLRQAAWGNVLSTIGGYVFGNWPLWGFDSGWAAALDSTGSRDMQRMGAFFDSIAWYALVPSTTIVATGAGSETAGTYVPAAVDPAGALAVAYVPGAHSGTITLDMTRMAGPSRARWYDPASGTYTLDSASVPNTGPRDFSVPGSNSAGANDWVLLLDRAEGGTLTPQPPAPARSRSGCGCGHGTWGVGVLLLALLWRRRRSTR